MAKAYHRTAAGLVHNGTVDGNLYEFACRLRASGCPHAHEAVRMAASRRLDLSSILEAYDLRARHPHPGCMAMGSLHELDEFDTIVDELCARNCGNLSGGPV